MIRIKGLINRYRVSIRFRMMIICFGIMSVLMLVNIYNYVNIKEMIDNINHLYVNNFRLNELKEELLSVQSCMTEYLENKNTDSMEDYYRHVQIYREMCLELNKDVIDGQFFIMEKNIFNISEAYIECTDRAIEYKRGRNAPKYRMEYARSDTMRRYLTSYIDSLNNSRFKANSANHRIMINVLEYTQSISIITLLIVIGATLILIYAATTRIMFPLRRLATTAEIVAGGKLDVEPVEITTNDEIGVVTRAFNKMLLSIREYIDKVTENMERERVLQEKELLMNTHLKEAQLNYLQAQINPHFLFNTLNAGAQLAMMEDSGRTYEYIQNVAEFYRYNIKNNKVVTLSDELEIVDNYMYIINVRYSGDLSYSKDIDESVMSVSVPSMILQPIVENSVRYSVGEIGRKAHICISIKREDDYICIRVSDNGAGMTEDIMNEVLKTERNCHGDYKDMPYEQGSNGVGLKNVIARLRLYFEADNVMEISSDGPGKGTQVTVLIPYKDC